MPGPLSNLRFSNCLVSSSPRAMLSAMIFSANSKECQRLILIHTCPQVCCQLADLPNILYGISFKIFREKFARKICRNRILIYFFVFVLMISDHHNHAISMISMISMISIARCFDFLNGVSHHHLLQYLASVLTSRSKQILKNYLNQ